MASAALDAVGAGVSAAIAFFDDGVAALDVACARRFSLSALQMLQLFGATAAVFVLAMMMQNLLALALPLTLAQVLAWTLNGLLLRRMLMHLSSAASVISFGVDAAQVTGHALAAAPVPPAPQLQPPQQQVAPLAAAPTTLEAAAPAAPAPGAGSAATAVGSGGEGGGGEGGGGGGGGGAAAAPGPRRELPPFLKEPAKVLPETRAAFPHSFESLAHVFLHRFDALPDPDFPDMLKVDVTQREEHDGGQVIEQTLVCTARADLPPSLTKFVSLDDVVVEERSMLDLANRVLEVRTRNITGPEYLTLEGQFVWTANNNDTVDVTSNCALTIHKWWLRSASSIIESRFASADRDNQVTMARRAEAYLQTKKND